MPFTNLDNPAFYPQDNVGNCSTCLYTDAKKYEIFTSAHNKSGVLPTINYFNERQCPIYVHQIKNDSSVYSNYTTKPLTARRDVDVPKTAPQNASKFVLDKLEETYWATWKPKRENKSVNKSRTPRKVQNLIFSDSKPKFQEHNKVLKKEFIRPHGDVSDNVVKHFKATDFNSGSTTDSIVHEMHLKKSNNLLVKKSDNITKTKKVVTSNQLDTTQNKADKKINRPGGSRNKFTKQESTSQEIQTVVHCPVILEENKFTAIGENNPNEFAEKVEDWNQRNAAEKEIITKRKEKNKIQQKESKQSKTDIPKQELPVISESNDNINNTFVKHKDSIEITKKKQENSGPKEHFQQPKCIRLYRKSGLASGYIKGGTYPLKSCLKSDVAPKGHFKLGAPGSTLFVTTSFFSYKRRK